MQPDLEFKRIVADDLGYAGRPMRASVDVGNHGGRTGKARVRYFLSTDLELDAADPRDGRPACVVQDVPVHPTVTHHHRRDAGAAGGPRPPGPTTSSRGWRRSPMPGQELRLDNNSSVATPRAGRHQPAHAGSGGARCRRQRDHRRSRRHVRGRGHPPQRWERGDRRRGPLHVLPDRQHDHQLLGHRAAAVLDPPGPRQGERSTRPRATLQVPIGRGGRALLRRRVRRLRSDRVPDQHGRGDQRGQQLPDLRAIAGHQQRRAGHPLPDRAGCGPVLPLRLPAAGHRRRRHLPLAPQGGLHASRWGWSSPPRAT